MSTLTYGSVFTGIAGFDLGFAMAGMHCAFQVENDADCQAVLTRRFPDARRYTDVTQTDPAELGAVDVLCGGFPCQDLSVAGRRAGLAGARSGLFHEFMRLVAGLAPRWVVIENVPGLLSSFSPVEPPPSDLPPGSAWAVEEASDFGTVLATLGELGYGWAYRVLDAQYFGVAQRRRRVFIVGCFGDTARAAQVLFEPHSGHGDPAPRRETGQGVAATLTRGTASGRGIRPPGRRAEDDVNLVQDVAGTRGAQLAKRSDSLDGNGAGGHRGDLDSSGAYVAVSHALTTPSGQRQDPTAETYVLQDGAQLAEKKQHSMGVRVGGPMYTLDTKGAHAIAFDERQITSPTNRSTVAPNMPAPTLNAAGEMTIAFHPNQDPTSSEEWFPALGTTTAGMGIAHSVAVRGREDGQAWELGDPEVGNALRAGDGGSSRGNWALTPQLAVRRLTPTECERLQGFPDGWTEGRSDSARYRMLGNAVAVPVAAWIATRLADVAGGAS